MKADRALVSSVRKFFNKNDKSNVLETAFKEGDIEPLDWIAMASLRNAYDIALPFDWTGLSWIKVGSVASGLLPFEAVTNGMLLTYIRGIFGTYRIVYPRTPLGRYTSKFIGSAPKPPTWRRVVGLAQRSDVMLAIAMFAGDRSETKAALKKWRRANHIAVLVTADAKGNKCVVWTWGVLYTMKCETLRRLVEGVVEVPFGEVQQKATINGSSLANYPVELERIAKMKKDAWSKARRYAFDGEEFASSR